MMIHFKKLLERFGKKSLLEQGVVLSFLAAAVIYGGTKPGNAPRMMIRSGDEVEEVNGFTTNELAVGVVQIYVRSNEVWNFNPPPGATVIEKWRLRGAAYDWHHFDCTNFVGVVFSDGRLRLQERQPCCHNSAPFAHEIATGCCATLAMTAGGSSPVVSGSSLMTHQPCCHNSAPLSHEIATGCCATLAMTAGGGDTVQGVVCRLVHGSRRGVPIGRDALLFSPH